MIESSRHASNELQLIVRNQAAACYRSGWGGFGTWRVWMGSFEMAYQQCFATDTVEDIFGSAKHTWAFCGLKNQRQLEYPLLKKT